MTESMILSKKEYAVLKYKADMFDQYIETEELSEKELNEINNALKGNFLTKAEFLKRHQEL